ncbi:MAG TPA: SRPBCC domain-containing protein [Candidatus Dormibacteraeota bacterium]
MIEEMPGTIEITQQIAAPPELVFKYLTDPKRFVQWMGVGAELDARPGGRFRIDVDGEHIAVGEYQEIDPPRRLVMSFGWQGHPTVPPGSTTVEITLTPQASSTVLRLRHLGLPSSDERRQHTAGWELYTGRLRNLPELS